MKLDNYYLQLEKRVYRSTAYVNMHQSYKKSQFTLKTENISHPWPAVYINGLVLNYSLVLSHRYMRHQVSPGTGEFPAQMASNAENVSIWGRHHVTPSVVDIQLLP